MPCNCRGRKSNVTYEWTDGTDTVVYKTEVEARAKVLRRGGSYTKVEG